MPQALTVPNEEQLSSYKKAVLNELNKYRQGIQDPGILRGFFGTDPERLQSVKNVLDKMQTHDLVFLYNIVTEASKVSDKNSRFRDGVGRAALSQLYHYLAGAAETFFAAELISSLLSQSISGSLLYGVLCFATDAVDRYFQKGVVQQTQINGITLNADENNPTELFDYLKQTFTNVSADKLLMSTQNVASNVVNFVHSNYLFFRNAVAKTGVAQEPPATLQHRRYFKR